MVFGILLFLFIVICILLCLLILIQSDKGGGISGAIGGGLSGVNNFLGTQDTANVLTKGTYIFGSIFLLLCVLMTFFAPGGSDAQKSRMQIRAEQQQVITPMPASAGLMGFTEEAAATEAGGQAIFGDIPGEAAEGGAAGAE